MIERNKKVKMSFTGQKIQYTFSWDQEMQRVIGVSQYKIEPPILLSHKVDPEISNTTYSASNGGTGRHYYADKELWRSVIDSKGESTATSIYFGIDATEYRLKQAYDNNLTMHNGIVGSVFMMLTDVVYKSSGEQELLLTELYDVDVEKAEDFNNSNIMTMEFNLGYMFTLMYNPSDKSQAFIKAGIRGV